ncbi:MAG: amino acid adenylation domain-containing protein [Ardenticatenales bacterium]|nr:amino acid adenylation domain-containing protein [Ardenticatenales bacterium]
MHFLLTHTIEQSAERLPDQMAFRTDEPGLTYAEFVQRTSQLANLLIELGVRKGDRVGIYLHKSLESALAIYGIMKAGAAYVPIDPSSPPARVELLVRDCGIQHLITQNSKLPLLAELLAGGLPLLSLIGPDRPVDLTNCRLIAWTELFASAKESTPHIPGLMEDDLAYIMYTSGSTGKPKGIMHTHRSGLSYAKASAHVYGVGPGDILGNHAPTHFDVSTFDYFAGPLAGATTLIIPEEYMKLPASLSELIQDEGITIWYSVVTALTELLFRGDLENRDLSALRWVKFCGEPFSPRHLRELMALLPNARFSNVYGPAEVNQCSYFHVPPLPNAYEERHVPIGRAWAIADSLVVDMDDNEVAPGESGELLIAAPTRMQGYWQQPELTEAGYYRQRPFPGSPFEKIFYRTGDIVRLDEQGELDFLGRKDRQIKIRGFRVELDEIEAALTELAGVAEAAVYLLEDEQDELRIEAAVLLQTEGATDVTQLGRQLAERLPSYAVPATIHLRDSFPRTGSGKINRRALKELARQERETALRQAAD